MDDDVAAYQARFTHPLLDVHSGFAHRPGYYAKLSYQPPLPVLIEAFHYDNRADPEDINADSEWGWRTRFTNLGLVAKLGPTTHFRAQALRGTTRMGYRELGGRDFDNHFRSAFALVSQDVGTVTVAVRADGFATSHHGTFFGHDYDEIGWSTMINARRDWGRFSGLVEWLHVSSRMEDLRDFGLSPRQRQTQVLADLRMHW
jgi:hypothetical protein